VDNDHVSDVDFPEVVAVSMDDLFGEDASSANDGEEADVVPEANPFPKKKLAWSSRRRTSTLSSSFRQSTSKANFEPELSVSEIETIDPVLEEPQAPAVLEQQNNAAAHQCDISRCENASDDSAAKMEEKHDHDELPAAAASPSSSDRGLLGLFKESTKKIDSFLSGASSARHSVDVSHPRVAAVVDAAAHINHAPADPLVHASQDVAEDSVPLARDVIGADDVSPVILTSSSPTSSDRGLLGLFKESTKKIDSFLSGASSARHSVDVSHPRVAAVVDAAAHINHAPAD
jgi:hypothetical protein